MIHATSLILGLSWGWGPWTSLIYWIIFESQVLEENELSCTDLLLVDTDGVILTKRSKKPWVPIYQYQYFDVRNVLYIAEFSNKIFNDHVLIVNSIMFIFPEAEKVVGWAKNHYLSSCLLPSIKGERLHLPRKRYMFRLSYIVCSSLK